MDYKTIKMLGKICQDDLCGCFPVCLSINFYLIGHYIEEWGVKYHCTVMPFDFFGI